MKAKIIMLFFGLTLLTATVNQASAQRFYPRHGYCRPYRPYARVVIAPPLLVPPLPIVYGPVYPHRAWVRGYRGRRW